MSSTDDLKALLNKISSGSTPGLMSGSGGWTPDGAQGINYDFAVPAAGPSTKGGMDPVSGEGGNVNGESGIRQLPLMDWTPDWMPDWLQQPQAGTVRGFNLADNGGMIGSGASLLLGFPGFGIAGRALGNEYLGDHYFQNDYVGDPSEAPGPADPSIADMIAGGPGSPAYENAIAEMNSSPGPSGGYSDGSRNPQFDQSGNMQAGMASDFKTQFNWAHGG